MSDKLTIGQIAKKAMISTSTVRLWIKKSLIKPPRRSWSGYRLFTDKDIAEILKVKELHLKINTNIGKQLAQRTSEGIRDIAKSAAWSKKGKKQ